MVKNVEVEGGELALQNSNGDIAIIPKRYRREVEDMIKDGCYDCIDDFVSKLPSTTDYAEAGALFSNPTQPTQPVTQVNLPTFDVVADKNTKQDLPYYNQLTEQQKGLMEQDNPIGRSIRHEAREGQQFSADDAKDYLKGMTLGGASHVGKTLAIPQSAMVEGIEALRGNEYDMSNALPNYGSYDSNQRVPSETFGKDLKPVDKFVLDLLADPTNIVGAGLLRGLMQKGAKGIAKNVAKKGTEKGIAKPIENSLKGAIQESRSVDDIGKGLTQAQAPKPAWQMQEMPGLHLKSTMEGQAISKIVDKTGKINTEQALAIIGKESGGAEKVALIKQGLGDNIPKKMDFNEFRKVTQDQLIPLERQFSSARSDYGIDKIGYSATNRNTINADIIRDEALLKSYLDGTVKPPSEWDINILRNNIEFKKEAAGEILENQTLILGNKNKFGRGSSAHGNPDETLGHAHFLRDAETPDVLTVTQIQSDAFQGSNNYLREAKEGVDAMKSRIKNASNNADAIKDLGEADYKRLVEEPNQQWLKEAEERLSEALGTNPIQKQLLDKNHQERYLQELVDYAGKRGDVNKVRVPTSETAAKVQGYFKLDPEVDPERIAKIKRQIEQGKKKALEASSEDKIKWERGVKSLELELQGGYEFHHQTILKKYSEQPKTIKKLFGQEPKIVTDSRDNTWYEFGIPDKAKKGKMEIKAFTTTGAAIGTGAAVNQNNKEQ